MLHHPGWASVEVPLLHLPERLSVPVALLLGAGLLAGLDLLGAVAAKNLAARHSVGWFLAGAAVFVLLFWVYASLLDLAELSVVTMAWIVLLQVAVVVLDRVRYQVHLNAGQVVAIAAILALQGYLVMSTSSASETRDVVAVTAAAAGSGR